MKSRLFPAAVVLFAVAPVFGQGGGVFFFTNQSAFEQFNISEGKFLKDVETFEESVIGGQGKIPFPAPLQHGVGNSAFPNGIDATNLIIQDNTLPGPAPMALSPSGNPQALFATGPGFAGGNSVKVGEDMGILFGIHVSTDLIFLQNGGLKTGVGFNLSRYSGFGGGQGFVISVFDTSNALVGQFNFPEPAFEPAKDFFGVWAPSIGRINIYDHVAILPEGIDNIQMWIPEPTSLALLVPAILLLRRRR